MKFEHTVGHKLQKEMFQTATDNQALSHAYVFVGPKSVGKTTFAKDLAINLGANSVYDMFVLDEEEIKVEDIRALQNKFSLKSTSNKWKVAILAHADQMGESASNALLKLLEEPVKNSMLILTAENFYKLLPTVRSRVQKIQFSKLSGEEMNKLPNTEDSPDVKELSQGRPGLAIRLSQSEELLKSLKQFKLQYEALSNDAPLSKQLLEAESFSQNDKTELLRGIDFFIDEWVSSGKASDLGRKLFRARLDIQSNLNQKLTLDNLFLQKA